MPGILPIEKVKNLKMDYYDKKKFCDISFMREEEAKSFCQTLFG